MDETNKTSLTHDGITYRIRKLSAKECWRLMGFADADYEKAAKVNSKTQLYKQAGNSIVVNCLEAIFRQMNIQGIKTWNELIEVEDGKETSNT